MLRIVFLPERSKTYSISASKGQIMSVSIHQGWEGDRAYIPMQITGADGTVLCPPLENTDCEFWRGVLPATQDYFVKVMPVNDIMNFTMRVAINPPGVAAQSFQYKISDKTQPSPIWTISLQRVFPVH